MKDYPFLELKSSLEFRTWLDKNHKFSDGVMLIFYKKHTGKCTFSYKEALDEALCYGWIDSTVRRIDDEKYSQVFSPRKNIKNWSDVNKQKVLALIEAGRMTKHGLNKIDQYVKTGRLSWKKEGITKHEQKMPETPDFFIAELKKTPETYTKFQKLSPSHKKAYLNYIISAKKLETQINRAIKVKNILLDNKSPNIL
ncbi:MAG: hypothetical protein C0596_08935 [Marinilabiliales bacterium]|nr:MAG: hypothetical protein C0596_08935 [Marinilabiliales bacterium]